MARDSNPSIDYTDLFRQAREDPSIPIDVLCADAYGIVRKKLEGAPPDAVVSEWKTTEVTEPRYEYHLHTGLMAASLTAAYRTGHKGGPIRLERVWAKGELEKLMEEERAA